MSLCINIPDFVKKERSPMGKLDLTLAAILGTGKCSALVTEQFAFQQRFCHRATIHDDQREEFSRTQVVDCARNQLFSRSTFAANHYRRIRRRNGAHHIQDLLHFRRFADDLC